MIRAATAADLDAIVSGYQAHFAHEREHGAYTVFQENVYPIPRPCRSRAASTRFVCVHKRKPSLGQPHFARSPTR